MLPLKLIVGACVGGGLFLISLLYITVAVLCRRKTSNQNHQQQALQNQPQPRQQQRTYNKARNITEQGYIKNHMAPYYGIPFNHPTDFWEYLQATPANGIPMGQMATSGGYVDVHIAPQQRIPFNYLAYNGAYLHTLPVRGIPMSQMADNELYANAHMSPRGRHVMIA